MQVLIDTETITRLSNMDESISWIMQENGMLLWLSDEAKNFLQPELEQAAESSTVSRIQEAEIYRTSPEFHILIDYFHTLDRQSTVVYKNIAWKITKNWMPESGNILCTAAQLQKDPDDTEIKSFPKVSAAQPIPIEAGTSALPTLLATGNTEDLSSLSLDLDERILETLAVMGQTIGADRAYVFLYDWQEKTMSNSHEWCAPGVIPEKDNLQMLPVDVFPWWFKNIKNLVPIIVNRLEDLPEEAETEKAILAEQGIQSLVVLPIIAGETIKGFVGFDAVTNARSWLSSELTFLKMYSNLIGSMFSNYDLLQTLVYNTKNFQKLFTTIATPALVLDCEFHIVEYNTIWEQLMGNRNQVGKPFSKCIAEAFRTSIMTELQAVLDPSHPVTSKNRILSIYDHQRKIHQMEMFFSLIEGSGVGRILVVFHDVTELLTSQSSIERLNRELVQNYLHFVDALSSLYERYDPKRFEHHSITSRLSLQIAERMGLPASEKTGLYIASLLHDLGNITIPAGLLYKNDKLTQDEIELVRQHTVEGASILSKINFPWPVTRIILEHHEHIDGSGYPNSKKADELLLESKILIVADVFESLTSPRAYREPLMAKEALDFMARKVGEWYDPEIFSTLSEFVAEHAYRMRMVKKDLLEMQLGDFVEFSF